MHAALIVTSLALALRSASATAIPDYCTGALSSVDLTQPHASIDLSSACQQTGIDNCCITVVQGSPPTCSGPAPFWTATMDVNLESVVGQQAAKTGQFAVSTEGIWTANYLAFDAGVSDSNVLVPWFHGISEMSADAFATPDLTDLATGYYFLSSVGNIYVTPNC